MCFAIPLNNIIDIMLVFYYNINNIKIEKEVLLNEFKRMCRYDF